MSFCGRWTHRCLQYFRPDEPALEVQLNELNVFEALSPFPCEHIHAGLKDEVVSHAMLTA